MKTKAPATGRGQVLVASCCQTGPTTRPPMTVPVRPQKHIAGTAQLKQPSRLSPYTRVSQIVTKSQTGDVRPCVSFWRLHRRRYVRSQTQSLACAALYWSEEQISRSPQRLSPPGTRFLSPLGDIEITVFLKDNNVRFWRRLRWRREHSIKCIGKLLPLIGKRMRPVSQAVRIDFCVTTVTDAIAVRE